MGLHDIQKIDVRLPLTGPAQAEPFLDVFGRFRMDEARAERDGIVDLADYAHLPLGPRALLVAQLFQLSADWDADGPAVLLSVRGGLEGSLTDRLRQAIEQARTRADDLLSQPELEGLSMDPARLRVTLNDRNLAPNDDATHAEVAPALAAALGDDYVLEREGDPGRRLGYFALKR